MARIYVSSTYSDLKECRKQVFQVLRRLGHVDIAMEYYVAEDRRPLDRCLEDVASCDLYIGIFAWRYGHIPQGQDKSITELEFRKAVEKNKSCLIFLLKEDAKWPINQIEFEALGKIKALRNEISEKYLAGFFEGDYDIQVRVMEAVVAWQGRHAYDPAPPGRQLFQAPPLPAYYVERATAVGEVIRGLLDHTPEQTGILVVSALHGLAGVGKTALAAAIAHNQKIRNRFKDGILWTTLGQEPDCLSNLVAWIHALGDRDYRPTTTDAASSYLRTLLYPTASLMVVDDVWKSEHAKPFLAGGPHCRLLITTRRAHVADDLGAALCPLDAMTQDEAVTLLKKRIEKGRGGNPLSSAELEHAVALAQETGYLPLALELMGALIARGYGWSDARNLLTLEQTCHVGAGARQHPTQLKLEASLRVSLNRLQAEDLDTWTCFAWLGVLPDDVTLNPQMAATLWEVSKGEAGRLLNSLADEAILQRANSNFTIHDLMHDMCRRLLTLSEPEGLGFSTNQAHRALLDRYASQIPDGRWDLLPDNGYIHSRLLWHFEQSGAVEAAHQLLSLNNSEGRNAWYVVRDQLGQSAGFLEDVLAARRMAYEAENFRLARQCRYALIISSLNSLAQTISPGVLLMLVQHGTWTSVKALDCISQMVDVNQRADALAELCAVIESGTQGTRNDRSPTEESIREAILRETRSVVRSNVRPERGARALAKLSHYFTGGVQAELVRHAVLLASDSVNWVKQLSTLVPAAFRDGVLEKACNLCTRLDPTLHRAISLAGLIPSLSSAVKSKWVARLQTWIEALEVDSTERKQGREVAVASPPRAPGDKKGLAETRQSPRGQVLQYSVETGVEFPPGWLSRILQTLPDRSERENISALARRVVRPIQQDVKPNQQSVVKKFHDCISGGHQTDLETALKLFPELPTPRDAYARELLGGYGWLRNEERGEILSRLAAFLSPEGRKQAAEALIKAGRGSVGARCVLAAAGAGTQSVEAALVGLETLSEAGDREAAMLAIARTCPSAVVRRALLSYQRIGDMREQASLMFTVAPYLCGELSSELFGPLSDENRSGQQIASLTRMVAQLASALKGGILDDFIKMAARLSSEWWIVEALTLTVLRLNTVEELRAVLKAVGLIKLLDLRSRMVGRIVLRLARLGFVKEAISAVDAAPLADRWALLSDLSSELAADGWLLEAEEVSATILDPEERSKAGAAVALHLAARGRVEDARAVVQKLRMEHWRKWVESRLAMLDGAEKIPILGGRRQISLAGRAGGVNFESLCESLEAMLKKGVAAQELGEILVAAKANNLEETVRKARTFWRTKVDEEKTYLDIISERPRRLFLKDLQTMWPLLNVSLEEGEVEELVSAIQDILSWWP